MQYWRQAGLTYIQYSNICAGVLRRCLVEPARTNALKREEQLCKLLNWKDGAADRNKNASARAN